MGHGSADPGRPDCIALTGSTGFIGGWVLSHVRQVLPDAQIRVLSRGVQTSSRGDDDSVTVIPGDLGDASSLEELVSGTQVLLHCASYIGPSDQLATTVNRQGTEALVAAAWDAGVARTVYVSTAGVYGRGPFTNALPATTPTSPSSPTSRTRLAAEQAIRSAEGTVLRPNLVFGTGDRWVGPRVARLAAALGDRVGTYQARLSMIDVRRLAEVIVTAACVLEPVAGGRVYDCNHPEPVTAHKCLSAFAGLCQPSPEDQVDPRDRSVDLTHDESMISKDHWFASGDVWRDCRLPPGPVFENALTEHTSWYQQTAGRR